MSAEADDLHAAAGRRPVYLNANWPGATVNEDWVTRIHLAAPDAKGSVERYAVTLVRKKPADDRNALRATSRPRTASS